MAVLVGGVFNGGILANPGPGATYDYQPASPGLIERASQIQAVCAGYGLPLGAVALHFVLRHPAVTAAVIGARSAAEISEDTGYLAADVPEQLFTDLARQGLIPASPEPRGR